MLQTRRLAALYTLTALMEDSYSDLAAYLLLSCPQSADMASVFASLLPRHGLRIVKHTQYTDAGLQLIRLELYSHEQHNEATRTAFEQELTEVARQEGAKASLLWTHSKPSVGLFCSNMSHVLEGILNQVVASDYPSIDVAFVVSDTEAVRSVADRFGLPFFYIPENWTNAQISAKQCELVERYQPQFLGLARYDVVLSQAVIAQANCPIVNVHNSFVPAVKGEKAFSLAYEQGVKLLGATARLVQDKRLGPIVDQQAISVGPGLSEAEIIGLGHSIERKVFTAALRKLVEHKVMVYNAKAIVFD